MSLNQLLLVVFLFNLPFGYKRSRAVTYSTSWLLYIHIPVPFVIALRLYYGFGWSAAPLLVLADIAGQLVGGQIGRVRFSAGK